MIRFKKTYPVKMRNDYQAEMTKLLQTLDATKKRLWRLDNEVVQYRVDHTDGRDCHARITLEVQERIGAVFEAIAPVERFIKSEKEEY